MRSVKLIILGICLISFFLIPSVHSQSKVKLGKNTVQFSIFSNLQVVDDDKSIYGIRFTCPYGVNKDMIGFDFGGWSETYGYQYGVQANCLVAYHAQDADGFNFAGIVNYTDRNSTGCVIGGIYTQVRHKITGFQAGLVSKSTQVSGVQFSLFNYCEDLNGVQLGLINIYNNGTIPFTILFNIGNSGKSK